MSFNWNPTPNPPVREMPQAVPPGEVTYEVKLVANSVNYGGTVRYNTANRSYDIVYEFPTLNVVNGVFENGFFESANIGNATINVATINQATINTANITNATITFGYATGSPNANMGIASKFYVDNAVASISGGAGPDDTANLFISTGDLLVGVSVNTANRLGVGSDGQLLTVFGSDPLKARWKTVTDSQVVTNLFIGTHWHPHLKRSHVLLKKADGIIMDDGEAVAGWANLTANINFTGPGGLDTSSTKLPNTWYEVWAIRNSTTGAQALLLHQMLKRVLDQQYTGRSSQGSQALGFGTPNLTNIDQLFVTKVSQSFKPGMSGTLRAVAFQLAVYARNSTVPNTVGNVWVTLEGDDGTGNADGVIHATSRKFHSLMYPMDINDPVHTHFVFDTAPTVSSGDKWLAVLHEDWPINAAITSGGCFVVGNVGPLSVGQSPWMANVGYNAGGSTYFPYSADPNTALTMGYGDARQYNVALGTWKLSANTGGFSGFSDFWFNTWMEYETGGRALPAGYDQTALLSYVRTNASSNFKEYKQKDRTLSMGFSDDWLAIQYYEHMLAYSATHGYDVSSTVPPIRCKLGLYWRSQTAYTQVGAIIGNINQIEIDRRTTVQTAGGPSIFFDNGLGGRGPITPVVIDEQQILLAVTVNSFNAGAAQVYLSSLTF